MNGTEFEARWSPMLRAVSTASTLLLLGIGFGIPAALRGARLPAAVAVAISILPLLLLVGTALFTIRGYAVRGDVLEVKRLFWSTRLPLTGLRDVWAAPDAMSRSIRIFGNGGLFSFSGLFRNRRLGMYRAYVTAPRNAVVLEFPDRKVVVSPTYPDAFIGFIRASLPLTAVHTSAG